MQRRMLFTGLLIVLASLVGAQATIATATNGAKNKAATTRFKVRIENISSADGQRASDGTRWPFALSPGLWVVDGKSDPLFSAGKKSRANGLVAQAEDGNPEMLLKSIEAHHATLMSHGIFNTPVGASAPGPIGPGAAYEFNVSAAPGMKLMFTTMFGQSNDLFYAPAKAIPLFDLKGRPVSGDLTSNIMLWDAGTEVNQEPGVGPDQAPRQKAPNTGAPESKTVGAVSDQFNYPKTSEVIRVTITPEM
jgi:hypothetical protein